MTDYSKVNYYGENKDFMWNFEVEALSPWLFGKGVDIGSGMRSPLPSQKRVDIDERVHPDFHCSGDNLPFKDGEYDFITAIHAFEHFEDQHKTLKEWLRVVKVGGIIAIVHPDITYTKKQNPEIDTPGLKENPHNKHWHETDRDSFIELLDSWVDLPFNVIDQGPACPEWSFYVILKKTS